MGYDALGNFVNDGADEISVAVGVATTDPIKTGATAASDKFRTSFKNALNMTAYETFSATAKTALGYSENDIARDVISNRKPAEIMDAFSEAKHEWKGVMDQIKADPKLAESLKNVLVKDPTMLEGFGDMFGEMGNANPDEMAEFLKNDKNRKALGKAFDMIAEKEDLTFKDFRELYDNRNDQAKTVAKLGQMGVGMGDMMDLQSALQMLNEFLRNPGEFLNKLPDMLENMGVIGPIQAQAFRDSSFLNGVETYADVVLGGISGDPKGYGGHLADGIEWAREYYGSGRMEKDFNDLTGESDKAAVKATGTEGDKNNVVSSTRLTDKFDLARLGIAPTVTPEQEREVAAYDVDTQRNVQQRSFGPVSALG